MDAEIEDVSREFADGKHEMYDVTLPGRPVAKLVSWHTNTSGQGWWTCSCNYLSYRGNKGPCGHIRAVLDQQTAT